MKRPRIFLAAGMMFLCLCSLAQSRKDKNPVTYEELYDEPYQINKLFVQFQPMYGELYVSNVNAGFGLEATYFWKDKMTFRAHGRLTYFKRFDFTRDLAEKNSNVQNVPNVFNYYEAGATYHIKDFEESSSTKMFLYKKSYRGARWASRVPLTAEIPCKVRKIYGTRLGGIIFDTSVDINRSLEAQDKTSDVLVDTDGNSIPAVFTDGNGEEQELDIYSGQNVAGIYVGGSISWIKNVAVDFDSKYTEGVDDLIFTAFLDIIVAPSVGVDDIRYNGVVYSSDALDTSIIGFRAGIDGKFNRTWSWGYGGEVGIRPGLKGRGFYALVKISFPVFSTNLDYSVEAFGK
ncbi:hypothetical protein [Fulvivirga sp. M361]|uniref:hypothetical protein n=1 Tax=Fulvivirga sp. M361 TaxID=2594266 RepID=UPI002104CCBC|nr:hypothetical protein [Fulvivirga sp. M361]